MEWRDKAVVLGSREFGEGGAIVSVLSYQYGHVKAMVKGAKSKRLRGVYEIGNVVEVVWRGRLADQLGYFQAELLDSVMAVVFQDRKRIVLLGAIGELLVETLAEREPFPAVYEMVLDLLAALRADVAWESLYVRFEISLLQSLGYGLDLSCCAATGVNDNLIYVSPKTGRAVSAEAGEPYKARLLVLPDFVKNEGVDDFNSADIKNGLALSGYFLDKYVFQPCGRPVPRLRQQFVDMVVNE